METGAGVASEVLDALDQRISPVSDETCLLAKNVPNIALGDLVLVQDEELKRGKWPLARVTKILPGKDDVVRVVEVKTKSGVYTRPVAKLFRLEHDDD